MKSLGVLLATALVGLAIGAGSIHYSPAPQVAPSKTAIIVLENKSANAIVGKSYAPYLNSLIQQGTRFTNYREGQSQGPSLPDYLQLVAGSSCGRFSDTVHAPDTGISNACPSTVWNQLESDGETWGLYMDKMPSACFHGTTSQSGGDQYALKHNPGPMFSQIPNCSQHVLPFASFDVNNVRDVSFISPSICNDMHGSKAAWAPANCAPGSHALIQRGDNWVKALVPDLLANDVTTFVTFDEAGVLYAVAVGPGVASGVTDSAAYTHYSWLAAIEDRYGLPRLRSAVGARPLPL